MKIVFILFILSISFTANSQTRNIPDYVPKCGLVAWYPFTGNAIDSSGNKHNGTVHGATLTVDRYGHANTAYKFDGTSNYIIIPSATSTLDTSMDIDGSMSISVWIKSINYSAGYEQIFWRGDAAPANDPYSLYVDASTVGFRKDVGSGSSSNIVSYPLTGIDTNFHHIVVTYDSLTAYMSIYIDGKLVTKNNPPGVIGYPTSAFWNLIGAVDLGTWQFFFGSIDDVGLWNRALKPCEVSNLYLSKNICNCMGDTIGSITMPPDSLYITGIDTGCRTLQFKAFTKDTSVVAYSWNFGDGTTGTGNPVYHTYASGGTYTVVVTTTNKTGIKSTAYYTATIAKSSLQAFGDTTICIGASVQLNVKGGTNYSWSPSTNLNSSSIPDPVSTTDSTIVYVVSGIDDKGCPASDSVKIIVVQLPKVTAVINDKYQNCQTHNIQLVATGAKNYIWSPGIYCNDSTSSMPVVSLQNDAVIFTVKGTDKYGCVDTATVKVDPHKAAIVSLPGAFSPNADGANDVLYVRGANVSTLNFSIYNRWGQKVFETNDINKGWDGTFRGVAQPVDAYGFIISITSLDGCRIIKKGNVTLLR